MSIKCSLLLEMCVKSSTRRWVKAGSSTELCSSFRLDEIVRMSALSPSWTKRCFCARRAWEKNSRELYAYSPSVSTSRKRMRKNTTAMVSIWSVLAKRQSYYSVKEKRDQLLSCESPELFQLQSRFILLNVSRFIDLHLFLHWPLQVLG